MTAPTAPGTPDVPDAAAAVDRASPPDAPKPASAPGQRPRVRLALFVGLGVAVALALAFFVSPEASSEPDGLNKVAIDEGFADQETAHATGDGPLAGYEVEGVDDDRLGTGLAGIVGVAVTFAVAGGALLALRRIARRPPHTPHPRANPEAPA